MKLCLILLSAALLHTQAKVQHKEFSILVCSDIDAYQESFYGVDEEEKYHADFTQKKEVLTLPDFSDRFSFGEGTYEQTVANMATCRRNLGVAVQSYKHPAEPKDSPQCSVYPKHKVQLGFENTLICHITGFYPPHVSVSWTRNNVNLTDDVSNSRYHLTNDGTFSLVSRLSFTPAEGDIYTCTVGHSSLGRPLTKTWDVQLALPGVGPSVYCGVGLAAGLLGVAVGTFFLVKGNSYGYYMYDTDECITSSSDLSDLEYIFTQYFNKIMYLRFNSTVGKFVGYTKFGVYNAELRNKGPELQQRRAELQTTCKKNMKNAYTYLLSKAVKPRVELMSEHQASGDHPAMLICSAYDFFPPAIDVYWLRDGKKVTGDVTATEEMADGDWYYQVHSHLEYIPRFAERISCVVEHASSKEPVIYDWDPLSESEKNKIAMGTSGLVLGIILSGAGYLYYRKKSSGRILVPS
ncbi:hypothetical protein NFI96_029331 [Prochilodus magdalenae]|nr:hypothetical protein NFI96_029331 [Prochilodus magdalenae]